MTLSIVLGRLVTLMSWLSKSVTTPSLGVIAFQSQLVSVLYSPPESMITGSARTSARICLVVIAVQSQSFHEVDDLMSWRISIWSRPHPLITILTLKTTE